MKKQETTICALSTPPGVGGIAVIRVSGTRAKEICGPLICNAKGKPVVDAMLPNTAHFCEFWSPTELIDEVVVTYFEHPKSYTGEDILEISCHGSLYIQQHILETLIASGACLAEPGEFTLRGFLNGKFDLSQAEAVADLIDSHSYASHQLAIHQLRGGFSKTISELRQKFVDFAALMELELDFSDEDVEFADREALNRLLLDIEKEVLTLTHSFQMGNAIKHGIPVAIIGKPNVGKSTLLNALLNEERAIVSDIPGTTRDTVEDMITLEGTSFRFIDTAGIRNSDDEIENFGIERTYKAVEKASVILYMVDIATTTVEEVNREIADFHRRMDLSKKHFIIVANKIDVLEELPPHFQAWNEYDIVFISAKRRENIALIVRELLASVKVGMQADTTLLSNARHYEAMQHILTSVQAVKKALDAHISGDLIMVDVRRALYYLGLITGSVSTDEILGTVFGRFCIGK